MQRQIRVKLYFMPSDLDEMMNGVIAENTFIYFWFTLQLKCSQDQPKTIAFDIFIIVFNEVKLKT